ncbi:AAA family ATPase [Acidisoma cellulosilytica]|uniref:AAA family ATPase n=1 Tax=Acidisoma cellulosilyticum TaxID=2802395 RepID=A0A964E303_9PROT|nr:AAA family ATPase [Acidisoma cellulosilyticum]MCB8879767.1 AAA family ATPase [Acidisoma cellulosilyticum]
MMLKEYRVREFRSIWDTGPIKVDDQTTCFVGKNEAGKTTVLTALYRTNPIRPSEAVFDETYDYPKREVEDYRYSVESREREKAVVVSCTYELEQDDFDAISNVFGPKAFIGPTFTRDCYYGKNNSMGYLTCDDAAARKHLADNAALNDDLKTKLLEATDWRAFAAALNGAEVTEAVTALKALVTKAVKSDTVRSYIYHDLIWPRVPKFLYFDEYYQMEGQANLNALISREDNDQLLNSDYPLIGLINLARLDHRKLVATNNTVELKNKLQGAGNHLTQRIIKYWSQNRHIQMRFDVRDAKAGDPAGMQQGVNVWGEVYDSVHWATTPLSHRSRGFVWFFSFLAWYEDVKRKKQNVILLLDEPGLSLHGRAQADLLRYFDSELSGHQLLYTTHSPFMIDPTKFERVRIVQDLGIDAPDALPKAEDGTKVLANVFDATDDSLFPLQGALGYEIQQTLFIGPNALIVEGVADMLYLRAVAAQLAREGREGLSEDWVITPVGGSGKVPTFVALLGSQKGINVATLLDIQNSDKQLIEDLYKKNLLTKKQVSTYADFTGTAEADVEDMFERSFYIELVNNEYGKQLASKITPVNLNQNVPRTLRAIDAWLADNPMKSGSFGHYRPARYFTEQLGTLWPKVSDETRNRFEAAFKHLNGLLRK